MAAPAVGYTTAAVPAMLGDVTLGNVTVSLSPDGRQLLTPVHELINVLVVNCLQQHIATVRSEWESSVSLHAEPSAEGKVSRLRLHVAEPFFSQASASVLRTSQAAHAPPTATFSNTQSPPSHQHAAPPVDYHGQAPPQQQAPPSAGALGAVPAAGFDHASEDAASAFQSELFRDYIRASPVNEAGGRSYACLLCNAEALTDEGQLRQHLRGKRHAKSLRKAQLDSSEPNVSQVARDAEIRELWAREQPLGMPGAQGSVAQVFFCSLCSVDCTSATNLQMHMAGIKHMKKMRMMQQAGFGGPSTMPQPQHQHMLQMHHQPPWSQPPSAFAPQTLSAGHLAQFPSPGGHMAPPFADAPVKTELQQLVQEADGGPQQPVAAPPSEVVQRIEGILTQFRPRLVDLRERLGLDSSMQQPGLDPLLTLACIHNSSLPSPEERRALQTLLKVGETDYESLECLGDAVCALAVKRQLLVDKHASPAEMTSRWAFYTTNAVFGSLVDNFQLGQFLVLGGNLDPSMMNKTKADFFEALMGAIYLAAGEVFARKCVIRMLQALPSEAGRL